MSEAPKRIRRATGPDMDLIRKIHEKTERGLHVTVHEFPEFGFFVAEAHEPTDEARQACIDEFNSKYRKQGE